MREGKGNEGYRPGDFARTATGLPAFPSPRSRQISQRHGNGVTGDTTHEHSLRSPAPMALPLLPSPIMLIKERMAAGH